MKPGRSTRHRTRVGPNQAAEVGPTQTAETTRYLAGDAHLRVPLPKRPRVRGHPRHGRPAPTACEICGATPVSRVFSPIAISFTGKGFYATDYGQGEQKPEAAASGGDGVKASDDGARKTDEKTTKKSQPEEHGSTPFGWWGPRSNCALRRMRPRRLRGRRLDEPCSLTALRCCFPFRHRLSEPDIHAGGRDNRRAGEVISAGRRVVTEQEGPI